jgi:cobaltochelatase CobT
MTREGLLKENIDGEALLWASERLEKQVASNKLLFVFSDGASVDDSTLSANPADFLEKHLLGVIAGLSGRITLYAVGIERDVSQYYPNSVAVSDTSSLGLRFFDLLVKDPVFLDSWKVGRRPRPSRKRKSR